LTVEIRHQKISPLKHLPRCLGIEGFIAVPHGRIVKGDEEGKGKKNEKPVALKEIHASSFTFQASCCK
jgi:hypothetical protein